MKVTPWIAFLFAAVAHATPIVVDDAVLLKTMSDKLGTMAEAGNAVSGETILEMLKKAPLTLQVELPDEVDEARDYARLSRSVFLVGSVYDCGKCDLWHHRGLASAFCLSSDGLMITNHHVFASGSGDSWGICGMDGEVYQVTEILAADADADLALFRVDTRGEKLQALALADPAAVGTQVRIVSHPERRFFFQTSGEIARYVRLPASDERAERIWMSVTADFAKGSSGAPVVDPAGRVTGVVANTQSIYYGARRGSEDQRGPLQMVVKNCTPVSALHTLLGKTPVQASAD